MKDFRPLLKNGVFGCMNDGKLFVVVGDDIIYQQGGYDRVSYFNSHLETFMDATIERLATACSFNHFKLEGGDVIFDRERDIDSVTELTIKEIEERLGTTNLKIIGGNK